MCQSLYCPKKKQRKQHYEEETQKWLPLKKEIVTEVTIPTLGWVLQFSLGKLHIARIATNNGISQLFCQMVYLL